MADYVYPEPHVCKADCAHDERLMDFLQWFDQPAVRDESAGDLTHADLVIMFESDWDFTPEDDT